ncbi:MAG: BON domain-containing protein [Aridibacter famidurans]|nr:BON domain-containing protein [Aridibacter famidurans]
MANNYGYFRPGYERGGRGFLRGPGSDRRFRTPQARYFYHYGQPDIGGYDYDLLYDLVRSDMYNSRVSPEYPGPYGPRRAFHGDFDFDPARDRRGSSAFGPETGRYERMGFRREPAYTGDDYKRGYDRGYLEDFDYDREGRMWWNRASDEIASWFGDDEAQRRRELDAYFDGNRGKGPRSYIRSDERISEDVNDLLTDDYYVDASEIEVNVEDGSVTLEGKIPNRLEKRRAEDLALCVSGVKEVKDRLRLDDSFYKYGERAEEQAADKASARSA